MSKFHWFCKWEYSGEYAPKRRVEGEYTGRTRECSLCHRKQREYLSFGIIGGVTDSPLRCWEENQNGA